MSEIKLQAIVLSSYDYKEKDKLVTLFSLEEGIISAVVKGVKKEGAKLKFAVQPFCFLNAILVKRGNFYTLTSAELQDSFFDLTKNITSYYVAFSLLEVVQVSMMQNEPNPLVFVNLLKALKQICYDNLPAKLVLVKFMVGMLKVLGYRFNFKMCASCQMPFVNKKYLNLETGAFVCGSCVVPTCALVESDVFLFIQLLYQTEMERLGSIQAKETVVNNALKLITQNFEHRTEKKLKTIKQFI
jgi:DNA repair protein RecO (recombination protein O)